MVQALKGNPSALRIAGIGLGIVAAMFLLNSRYPNLLRLAELKMFDLRMHARQRRKPFGAVAIVAIDDKSIRELGRWPWPRTVFANLVDALNSYKAAVVGFDMVFSERDLESAAPNLNGADARGDAPAPAASVSNDDAFARAIKAQGSTLIGYPLELDSGAAGAITPGFVTEVAAPAPMTYTRVKIEGGEAGEVRVPLPRAVAYLPNLPVIDRAARGSGYLDTPTDSDAVLRSEMMVIRFGKLYCLPFILAVTSVYANGAPTTLRLSDFGVVRASIGPVAIPVDEQGRMLVNFRGPPHTFPYYSASDVIGRRVSPAALANKIVLVGAAAVGAGDRWSTPMGADFPGVEFHANAIDNILTGDFIQRSDVTAGLERAAAAAMGAIVIMGAVWLPASSSAVLVVALICGYLAFAQFLLVAGGLFVGVLFPLITAFVTYAALTSYRLYLAEQREKHLLREAVSKS